jgi:hypothetical protein
VTGRQGIRSPAAFLITLLKSEYKLSINNANVNRSAHAAPENYQTWAQKMAQSRYADFLVNADDLVINTAGVQQ